MSKICFGCVKSIDDEAAVCPHCGFDQNSVQSLPFLPLGAVLQEDKYFVGKKLSVNNESTRYLGYDFQNKRPVVIREFLPNGYCARGKASNKLKISSEKAGTYKALLGKFLEYNRTLVRLSDCSAVPKVLDIIRENNTAYVIEEKEDVISFTEYVKRNGGTLDWDTARPMFMPLLSTLETMHKNGISHYGVGPNNIRVTSDGTLKLLNCSIPDMRKVGGRLRSMLITGCSAPEQYDKDASLNESTDVYGFTASLFFALTGSVPASAEIRAKDKRLLIDSKIDKQLPPHVKTALASGLHVEQDERVQSFDELRGQLFAAPTVKDIREEISRTDEEDDEDNDYIPEKKKKKKRPTRVYGVVSCIISLVLFVIIGTYWLQGNPFASLFAPENASSDSDGEGITGETVTVPNLVGVKYEEAVAEADKSVDYQLLKAVEEEFSDEVPEGYIASQFPEAYSEETQGYSLYITVSKGAKMRELPKIEGKTVDQVAQLLGDESFVTTQTFTYSDTIKKGLVIGYDAHSAGDKLEYGSSLEIKVSLGSEKEAKKREEDERNKRNSDTDKQEDTDDEESVEE